MKVCIAATTQQQQQLLAKDYFKIDDFSWVANTSELLVAENADALIDCTFSADYFPFINKPVLFHSPINTLSEINAIGKAARFCAWNTFLERDTWDIAKTNDNDDTWINILMTQLGRKFIIVQDVPGLVAPRIVANIINEALYALQAGISTNEEIDLAMKLGTNYPYGPIEWRNKIGADNIYGLLQKLSNEYVLYKPVLEK